ncbi:MAG: hypothetical protein IT361_13700 [Gemmatimonadaceae bacterium]|nr:hypothetical protein [Gemmatimonadaceae bacterium]
MRIAFGSSEAQVARMTLRDGATMALAGTAVGAFLAMWLARVLDAMLYDVFYTDARALVVAEVLVIAVTFAAALVPARQAARSAPAEILRAR